LQGVDPRQWFAKQPQKKKSEETNRQKGNRDERPQNPSEAGRKPSAKKKKNNKKTGGTKWAKKQLLKIFRGRKVPSVKESRDGREPGAKRRRLPKPLGYEDRHHAGRTKTKKGSRGEGGQVLWARSRNIITKVQEGVRQKRIGSVARERYTTKKKDQLDLEQKLTTVPHKLGAIRGNARATSELSGDCDQAVQPHGRGRLTAMGTKLPKRWWETGQTNKKAEPLK